MAISVNIKNLDLRFGTVEVLKNLNISINQGDFLVLLGSSGCGKSTLLNCIAGLLDVSGGQIFIKGQNVTWAEPSERGIGMVFQNYALYPQMTVEGNMSFGLKNAKAPKAEIEARAARAAEVLSIEALLNRIPSALYWGQRPRVAIGRALVRDVDVFLFDEPLSNLDAKSRADLRVELKQLYWRLKNTMIYVTHDQIEAMTLADRIAIMKDGVIQQLASPAEIYNRPENLYVADFIGSPSMNLLKGRSRTTASRSAIYRSRLQAMILRIPPPRRPLHRPRRSWLWSDRGVWWGFCGDDRYGAAVGGFGGSGACYAERPFRAGHGRRRSRPCHRHRQDVGHRPCLCAASCRRSAPQRHGRLAGLWRSSRRGGQAA